MVRSQTWCEDCKKSVRSDKWAQHNANKHQPGGKFYERRQRAWDKQAAREARKQIREMVRLERD